MSAANAADDARPLTAADANALFAGIGSVPAVLLAVSGGSDSTALLWLAAQWRAKRKRGPRLLAVTVDHGLRKEAAAEARQVARLARKLGVPHRILRWRGVKPSTGLQEKARAMRYRLLADAAEKAGASHILTAHTLDDQAETVLMRLLRGSGPSGLAAMARTSSLPTFLSSPLLAHQPAPSPLAGEGWGGGYSEKMVPRNSPPTRTASLSDLPRKGGGEEKKSGATQITLLRPFLDIPKARLVATLRQAKIPFAEDPSNRDPRFTRVRMRQLLPALAKEGLDAKRLALLAQRLRRAEAALEAAVDRAAALAHGWAQARIEIKTRHFTALPAEIALRVLGRAVAIAGHEGAVELAKLEALYTALTAKKPAGGHFRRTLAGAMVTLTLKALTIEPAPARRNALTTPGPTDNKRLKRR